QQLLDLLCRSHACQLLHDFGQTTDEQLLTLLGAHLTEDLLQHSNRCGCIRAIQRRSAHRLTVEGGSKTVGRRDSGQGEWSDSFRHGRRTMRLALQEEAPAVWVSCRLFGRCVVYVGDEVAQAF